jgi:pantoate kinase
LKIGSTGAGINLHHGVTTSVKVNRAKRTKVAVFFNDRPLANPVVSRTVVREQLKESMKAMRVTVSHRGILPMGCGYGTSGAGALSLSLALNEALGSNLSRMEAAQIAHEAEVKNKTGLGTVTSAFYGGLAVRTRAGAPGFARVKKIIPSSSLRVVSGVFGPIQTSRVLSSIELKRRINLCGRGLVAIQTRTLETDTFLKLSRKFADCIEMYSPRLREALARMQRIHILSSMMMLGESLFTIVKKDLVSEAKAAMRSAGANPIVSRIAERGATVL